MASKGIEPSRLIHQSTYEMMNIFVQAKARHIRVQMTCHNSRNQNAQRLEISTT